MTTDDPKSFAERYVQAIQDWATAHPTVTLLDVADVLDTAPDADAVARFLANPEKPESAALTD